MRTITERSLYANAYIRVSTEDQNLGPEAQRASIEAWSAREGVQIVAWYTDHGVSGATPVARRPELMRAIAELRGNNAGVLVAAKRDRLARDVAIAATLAPIVAKEKAFIRTVDGMSDGVGAAGMIQRGVADLFAAYEREVIRERTTAALAIKKARGERVGTLPYGYQVAVDGVHLEPSEREQEILAGVRGMRAAGMSLRAITARIGALSRVGKPFALTQIAHMVRSATPHSAEPQE